jgi:tetratricopeptide (TPR) repeat protein
MAFSDKRSFGPFQPVLIIFLCSIFISTAWAGRSSISLVQAETQLRTGKYSDCLDTARRAALNNWDSDQWRYLLINSLFELGRYDQAASETSMALAQYPTSFLLLKLGYKTFRYAGRNASAEEALAKIYRNGMTVTISSWNSRELVILGDALVELGFDPRNVLDTVYNKALENDPNCRQVYISIGELALNKQDYDLAATRFRQGIAKFGDDPDMHCGLARALYHSDRKAMLKSIDSALVINPNHAPSLLLMAEHQIDCESYTTAAATLDRITKINPSHPQALTFRCVLAHLANDAAAEKQARANALKYWTDNPSVDSTIGSKLSQKYRFSEGAQYQRSALELDPEYIPAKIQLAQDLLRLGQKEQGWALAEEVYKKDKYNIQAYNLVSLHDHIADYKSLQSGRFTVQMEAREAVAYGQEVLKLIEDAESVLSEKYGMKLEKPVFVEIYPNQQDFAVRTFGIPGGDGYLGVCFGSVITANSPSAERPSNWQAMLWHEFAHVITLSLTNNKMPRWLSEGISVYEELQRNPTWGQKMNASYRSMILDKESSLVPISELSAAFLNPPSALHLMFAYYESSLVVEFIIKEAGYEGLRKILTDLNNGKDINQSIDEHVGSLSKLEKDFAAFAVERARNLAPAVDWERPEKVQSIAANPDALAQWLQQHPNSFWALTVYAQNLIEQSELAQAEKTLNKIIDIYPEYISAGNAYQLLADIYRSEGQTDKEREILNKLAEISPDAMTAYNRLMEIALQEKDWKGVIEYGQKSLSVYPLPTQLHQEIGLANEELGNTQQAIEAYQRLVQLDPADPVDAHYRLGRLLVENDPQAAKRHILIALADAPRFREGYRLLLKIEEKANQLSGSAGSSGGSQTPAVQEITQ